jgi:hypothetical protein
MVAQHDGVLIGVQLLPDVPRPLLLPAAQASHFPDTYLRVHMHLGLLGAPADAAHSRPASCSMLEAMARQVRPAHSELVSAVLGSVTCRAHVTCAVTAVMLSVCRHFSACCGSA